MEYIDENRINAVLGSAERTDPAEIARILAKSVSLQRLTIEETAALLSVEEDKEIQAIFAAASEVKNSIYGKRVVLFAPLYINNICSNYCLYCAFKADNPFAERKKLTQDEIACETRELLGMGHKRVLLVASEEGVSDIDYFTRSIKTIYAQKRGPDRIRRINVNCAPMSVEDYRKLKAEGIGTYQIFQETYHEKTYREVHPRGAKSDPDNRIRAVDRAFEAGIDDVGIGVLYGLYDYRFETLALMTHIEHLEKKFNVGPHTISIPRIEPAPGAELSLKVPYRVSDRDFKKLVAVIRLSVPYTGIILSTRETPEVRDELIDLGVSQISAASRTSPGGYSSKTAEAEMQFSLSDHRSLDEVISMLIAKKKIPSFCTACYRKKRTGEAFMDLARPGVIKGKCAVNAMITLKEYLDDFASEEVKKEGYRLIDELKNNLDETDRKYIEKMLDEITMGARDEFI
ncbi:MAG: [FeFe] hydrogenase H-cluster radical SAM maturase HydG [Candidatus Omnitrophota bacterium]